MATLNVYGHRQYDYHMPVIIAGTEEALIKLRDQINDAIATGNPQTAMYYESDGEGYDLEVVAHADGDLRGMEPPTS